MQRLRLRGRLGFTDGILLAALVLTGGFHEYLSCALSVLMCIWLLLRLEKGAELILRRSLLALSAAVLTAGYALTCLWAVDRGMALIGFFKFLPCLLYCLCLWQQEEHAVLECLPYCGAALTLLGAALRFLPVVGEYFQVAGRFAGVFEYPNTYALFLLICQLLLCKRLRLCAADLLTLAILIGGLLYTGSRTVFVIFLIANAALFALGGRKRLLVLVIGAGVLALLAAAVMLWGEGTVLQRYLTISFTQSTFVGRLLYMRDALTLLLRYPFGMGYMGYYYAQTGIQTGVYNVMFVHNDFLQFMLDVGILPGGLFVFALLRWFAKPQVDRADKVIVGALCLHTLLDFNFQFLSMLMLLMVLTDMPSERFTVTLRRPLLLRLAAALLAAGSLYMGISLGLAHFGQRRLSQQLYPYNTQNNLTLLSQTEDLEEANELADLILAQNTHHYLPYSTKARYCYTQGRFADLIDYKQAAFERNRFGYDEYEQYCYMLIAAIDYYSQNGDSASAGVCMKLLAQTRQQLADTAQYLSALGQMINDQPVTQLPADIAEYIGGMQNE